MCCQHLTDDPQLDGRIYVFLEVGNRPMTYTLAPKKKKKKKVGMKLQLNR
jgi:hypothetical protein